MTCIIMISFYNFFVISFNFWFFFQKYVNWCIKKEKKAEWTQVSLQESEEKATLISGGKITFYSKIQYHVTVVDSDVHFLCEISNSKTCGTGFTSVQTSVHVDTRKGNIFD